MSLSQNTLNPLLFRPKGYVLQAVDVAAADLILIPGATRVLMLCDQLVYIGLDRDAVIPGVGIVEENLLALPAGQSLVIYVGDAKRLSCIATVAGSLSMQELGDI